MSMYDDDDFKKVKKYSPIHSEIHEIVVPKYIKSDFVARIRDYADTIGDFDWVDVRLFANGYVVEYGCHKYTIDQLKRRFGESVDISLKVIDQGIYNGSEYYVVQRFVKVDE